ncbi:uncharacterized protein CDV56_103163 [Aspergillus thermomutatus]|uniref:Acyl-protein thioesterase 1 n=1 Tax=Aspergillus thermomutatus TaxID=41047 RepID=A0A397HP93_ASPTH|nr:uncharacterized protein CDV56_103163 [Aspergillus thermomutatus]RHZ62280.1 hypothetical protein CDV56_103163 [Aspergillus thermomutatus]
MVQLFPPRHVYFPSTPSHTCTVILLHDTNSTGAELAAALAASTSTATPAGKSIFEHFPSCRWAQAQAQLSPSAAEDLEVCVESILQIVEEEVVRLAGEGHRVVLGGFGQGMAVAAAALIAQRRRLGGFVGVSGWVPLAGGIDGIVAHGGLARDEAARVGSEAFRRDSVAGGLGVDGRELDADADADAGDVGLASAPKAPLQDGSAGSLWETPVLLSYLEDDPCVDIRTGLMAYETLSRMGFVKVIWDPLRASQQGENWLLDSSQLDTIVGFLAEVFGHEG